MIYLTLWNKKIPGRKQGERTEKSLWFLKLCFWVQAKENLYTGSTFVFYKPLMENSMKITQNKKKTKRPKIELLYDQLLYFWKYIQKGEITSSLLCLCLVR